MDTQSLRSLASIRDLAMNLAISTLLETQREAVVTSKGTRDLVTTADLAVEHAVREFLSNETPEIGFVGEEFGATGKAPLSWALDPIDGTVNFSRGLPNFAVSLALIDDEGAILSATQAPRLNERYSAVRGEGATLNGEAIAVIDRGKMSESVVCLDDYAPGARFIPERAKLYAALAPQVARIRTTGSAALDLAWMAAGRVDAVIMLSNQSWDTAGGVLLAREAGARVGDLAGQDHSIASASLLVATSSIWSFALGLVSDTVGLHDWSVD